ncbi:MAG: HDOD domain-containing protein [bacterium]
MNVFVARQPIFDGANTLVGYELLYRRDETFTFAEGADPEAMSARVISNAFLGVGIAELTGGVRAFVNFTRDHLVQRTYELFDPNEVIIELLETIRCDEETLRACTAMCAAGYRFALDDFVYDESIEPLLALADIVKLDVLNRDEADLRAQVARLAHFKGRLLAERVETQSVHASCERMGFQLFQGYFYARPETVAKEDLEASQIAVLRLLTLLRDDRVSDAQLGAALRGDPSLCYKLLRIVNSAAMGGQGIESIEHALRLVGRSKLHRWLAVIFAASFATRGGTTRELALRALARGRFCELVARRSARGLDAEALFMTGMISMMDALMCVPISRVVELVEVSDEVRSALVARMGSHAPMLRLADAYEGGDWDLAHLLGTSVGITDGELASSYAQSLTWAHEQLTTAAD